MKEKQTLPYRGSRKGFDHIEDEVYQKEGPILHDKTRLRTWIRGYEKHGEGVKDDEIIKKAKEMLAVPSYSSQVNSSYDENALSKLLKKRDRHGRVTAKGAGACQTKLNAINMTSKVVELEGDVSTLQGEPKDLRSLVEQQAMYINALLKVKGLDVEEHNDQEDNNDEDSDKDDDEDSDDEDSDGTDPKRPTNTSIAPQSQNGSINRRSKKCQLLNWTTRNEIVAIGSWMSDEPDTIVHFVPLGKCASKVWVDEVIQVMHHYLDQIVVWKRREKLLEHQLHVQPTTL